jgi:formylglycine-generating enzyme required for sulfatase activity
MDRWRVLRSGLRAALAALVLLACAAPATADDNSRANALIVETVRLIQRAEAAGKADEKVALLKEALENLDRIVERYAGSDAAVKLATGQSIGTISRARVARALAAAEAEVEKERDAAETARLEREHAARAEAELRAAQGDLVPGTVFRDCRACPTMVVVPAGSFTMGSPPEEKERWKYEGPQHRVTIDKPFAVGKYEVTFGEWDACVKAGICKHRPNDNGWGRGRRPVMNVSWDDAKLYAAWLSSLTGNKYRLLSEAEWEYAARAGTTTPFSTGETISTDQANYNGNYVYGPGRKGINRGKTVAVGSFPANRFGLHDMHGNVWEWVEDCWNESYQGAPVSGEPWFVGDCRSRVLRGGSWYYAPWFLRSAFRFWNVPSYRYNFLGFRLARTL